MNKMRVVVFGLGPQFKGGIANYTTSLAKTLDKIKNMGDIDLQGTKQQKKIDDLLKKYGKK